MDKDFLKVSVLETTSDWLFRQPSAGLVKLDETFYSSSIGPQWDLCGGLEAGSEP